MAEHLFGMQGPHLTLESPGRAGKGAILKPWKASASHHVVIQTRLSFVGSPASHVCIGCTDTTLNRKVLRLHKKVSEETFLIPDGWNSCPTKKALFLTTIPLPPLWQHGWPQRMDQIMWKFSHTGSSSMCLKWPTISSNCKEHLWLYPIWTLHGSQTPAQHSLYTKPVLAMPLWQCAKAGAARAKGQPCPGKAMQAQPFSLAPPAFKETPAQPVIHGVASWCR